MEILAPEIDGNAITVGGIMVPGLATVKEGMGVFEVIQYMRAKGVRRLPAVSESGGLRASLPWMICWNCCRKNCSRLPNW